jgi:AraC family transcriptional activator of tynA and feaB
VETYRASNHPSRTRAATWNEIYSSRVEPADITPTARYTFESELRVGTLGPVRVVRMVCGHSSIDRTARHIDTRSARSFTVLLQARGTGLFAQYGHESLLRAGDFSLCDSAAPHSYRLDEDSEVVMLRIPENILSEYLPSPENVCGRHLLASRGLTSTVTALTLSLCDRLEAGLPPDFGARVSRHLMELIATAYALEFDSQPACPSVISGRHAQVKLFIEQHLRDPHLTPSMIASRHKLSTRYLRMVFAVGGETISAYILRRRLEECARQISDPRWRGHSISEIAYAWGFNSTSHFARTFRMRFKNSPRGHRRLMSSQSPADELDTARGTERVSPAALSAAS